MVANDRIFSRSSLVAAVQLANNQRRGSLPVCRCSCEMRVVYRYQPNYTDGVYSSWETISQGHVHV